MRHFFILICLFLYSSAHAGDLYNSDIYTKELMKQGQNNVKAFEIEEAEINSTPANAQQQQPSQYIPPPSNVKHPDGYLPNDGCGIYGLDCAGR